MEYRQVLIEERNTFPSIQVQNIAFRKTIAESVSIFLSQ